MYLEYCIVKNIKSVYEHTDLFKNFCVETKLSIPIELRQQIDLISLNEWCDIYLNKQQ
jgi:hypothetical protein